MNKFIREGLFTAVFILIVVLIVGFLFEEFIPNEVIQDPSKYQQSSSTAKLLAQIKEEQQDEIEDEKKESVLQSYEVTSNELEASQNDSQYIQGKNHPFYDYTKATASNNDGSSSTDSGSGSTSNSGTSTTPDDLTSSNTNSNTTTNSGNTTNTNKINTNTLRDTSSTGTTSK